MRDYSNFKGSRTQILKYLGCYTLRIVISNNRIKSIEDGQVVFTYRDRAHNNELKEMVQSAGGV